MFQSYNDGECPQCALDHRRVEMRLNQDDHWECPECRLQMVGSGSQVMLLRERGVGDFKQPEVSATDSVVGAFMTRQSAEDPWTSDGGFHREADLKAFFDEIVDPDQ